MIDLKPWKTNIIIILLYLLIVTANKSTLMKVKKKSDSAWLWMRCNRQGQSKSSSKWNILSGLCLYCLFFGEEYKNFQWFQDIMCWCHSICVVPYFYLSKSLRGWRRLSFLKKYKINIVMVFSHYYVKLIILKDLMLFLVHYISQLFHFGTLSFKSFILIIYVFEIYHSTFFLNLKVNKTLMFLTKNWKKKQNDIFRKHKESKLNF